jgi:hypothetical protein
MCCTALCGTWTHADSLSKPMGRNEFGMVWNDVLRSLAMLAAGQRIIIHLHKYDFTPNGVGGGLLAPTDHV